MNRLHARLADLLGDYEVVRVGNKMSALRYAIDRREGGPGVGEAVDDLLQTVKSESLSTYDLCGGPAKGTMSFGATRCSAHQSTRERPVPGALARPPGWRPGTGESA